MKLLYDEEKRKKLIELEEYEKEKRQRAIRVYSILYSLKCFLQLHQHSNQFILNISIFITAVFV